MRLLLRAHYLKRDSKSCSEFECYAVSTFLKKEAGIRILYIIKLYIVFFRSFFFKNAGVVLMTNNFVSDGKEGEFAENKVWGILCHAKLLTDTIRGYLIQKS